MTPERYKRLRETLDRRQTDLTMLTEQIHKPRNVAALVRTADAVGITEMHMVWPSDKYRAYSGTAMGSDRWVDIIRHTEMKSAITGLQEKGYRVIAANLTDSAVDYRTIDYRLPTALLLGNEKQGVSSEVAECCDENVIIPMMGMVESYNVSVAAAIILAEAQHQRMQAGMYDRVNLPKERYWKTFFRWAHPQVADYCHQHGLDYPQLREEDGEIDNPSAWYASVRNGHC